MQRRGVDGVRVLTKTTIDLDSYIACKLQSDGKMGIEWSTDGNWSGVSMQNPAIVLDSTGDDYLFEVDCKDSVDDTRSTTDQRIEISDTTDGLKNGGAQGQGILKR